MKKQDDFDEKDLTVWTTYDPKKDNPNLIFTAKSDKPEVLIVGFSDKNTNCNKLNKHHVLKYKKDHYKCRYCTYTLSVDDATQLVLDGKYGKMYGFNDNTLYEQAQLEG